MGPNRYRSTGPAIYDAALPDSVPITLAATITGTSYGEPPRNISISAAGDFAVYAARHGDSTGLWYSSLRDGTVRPILGTIGATAPRISPDGARVAFLIREHRSWWCRSLAGKPAGCCRPRPPCRCSGSRPPSCSPSISTATALNWLDPEGGNTRTKTIVRCALGQWIPDLRQLLCSYNRIGTLVNLETGKQSTIRSARPDRSPEVCSQEPPTGS